MEVKESIQHILDGEGVLFLGSGFSLEATNIRDKKFISAKTLAKHFSSLSSLTAETELEDAAESFVDNYGIDHLIREVQELFTATKVCNHHRIIAKLPWKRVYTTNYDNVFEIASQLEGKRVTSITLSTNIYKAPKDHLNCIHFNGFVNNLDRDKILSELKLTNTSYVTASIDNSEWAMLFRQDIKLASTVVFIGYSLHDLDIKRILVEIKEAKEKTLFCVGPNPEHTLQRKASRYGDVLKISTEEFSCMVKTESKSYIPRDRSVLRFLSVREYKTPSAPLHISDQAFIDLLLWGRRKEAFVAESVRTNNYYYLKRVGIEKAIQEIDNGVSIIVVTSDLGNGKSMFLEGLKYHITERGFRVFYLTENNNSVAQELESIAKMGEKAIIIIEEYQSWLDEIRLICTNAGDQIVLVLTARNAVNDVFYDELTMITGTKNILELNIDLLDDTEVKWVIEALDLYGLWGQRAGLGNPQKIKYIAVDCKRQLHAVLLDLMSSPDIANRFSSIGNHIKSKGEHYEIMLSIFILTLLNQAPTIDIIRDIWGSEKVGAPSFRSDPIIKELVNVNYYAVSVRSSIAAQFFLHSFADPGALVPVLILMAKRIEKGRNASPRYNNIFIELIRYGSLQSLLPEKGRRDAVITYYEGIKNLDGCKFNPLFWLQFAIASLVNKDLLRAKKYFDDSYSLAKKKDWDTYQIDNHFARFLLVQAIEEEMDVSSALANYREAQIIIDRQIRVERRDYPYRVAKLLKDFIHRYGGKMGSSDIQGVIDAGTRILDRINNLPEIRRKRKSIMTCKEAMEIVINTCNELANKI